MADTAKNAILKAKIEGVISELMVKTDANNVYVDNSTTLAAKLTAIIADIATKASTTDLTNGLAGKADKTHTHAQSDITGLTDALAGKAATSHTHAQSDITGLVDALALLASKTEVTSAIDALRQEMLGDTPVEAYNTFTELAAYIAEHKEVSDALSAAIGNKADKATTLSGYGITDAYTKTEVDTKVSDMISAATGGESAASVKLALETYETSNDARVDALEADTHTHDNKTVLDGITAEKVTAWDGVMSKLDAGAFIVEMTGDFSSPSVDKTYAEIKAAYDSGISVYLHDHRYAAGTLYDYYYPLVMVSDDSISFGKENLYDGTDYVQVSMYLYRISKSNTVTVNETYKNVLSKETVESKLAEKSNVYYSAAEPANLTENDLWVQIV